MDSSVTNRRAIPAETVYPSETKNSPTGPRKAPARFILVAPSVLILFNLSGHIIDSGIGEENPHLEAKQKQSSKKRRDQLYFSTVFSETPVTVGVLQ